MDIISVAKTPGTLLRRAGVVHGGGGGKLQLGEKQRPHRECRLDTLRQRGELWCIIGHHVLSGFFKQQQRHLQRLDAERDHAEQRKRPHRECRQHRARQGGDLWYIIGHHVL